MQSLIRPAWLAKIADVATNLICDPEDTETWRFALVRVWTLLLLAPAPTQGTYGTLAEKDIVAAGEAAYSTGTGGPGPLFFADCTTDAQYLIRIAGWLRAAERWISEADPGPLSADPNEDWFHDVEKEGFFLVPLRRSAWRPPYLPSDPTRPYTRRALLRTRIIPAVIGGLEVRFTDYARSGPERASLVFGASLFEGFDVHSEDEADTTHFLARETVGPTAAAVRADIDAAARHACSVHVFPELTMMPDMRAEVPTTLARAGWNAKGETLPGPDFVVAGSWHERYGKLAWNEAVVYDRTGAELLRFRKLFRFKDEQGRYERIETGEHLEVLVTRQGLYGFGVCLDFCQKATPVLTDLDVDWMIIPSCGTWRTMQDHVSTAHALQVRYDTRSFVVQQVYPKRTDGGLGYVLHAPPSVGERTESDLRISQSFTPHMIVP